MTMVWLCVVLGLIGATAGAVLAWAVVRGGKV